MKDTEKTTEPPSESPSLTQKIMAMGSSLLNKFDPINNICDHVVGFHFYSGEIDRQLIAHHYCSMINKEMRQCLIYDSDKSDAKLIGIEYIISERLFKTLQDDEKIFWHSHVYEVKSGLLTCPRLPSPVEKTVMTELINTYGKTVHLWQIDRGDQLPIGVPKLMMACTEDGQAKPDLIRKRDELLGLNTEEIRRNREDIISPIILPGADDWKNGKATIFKHKQIEMNPNKH
jgi:hypothetical protein